MKVRMFYRRKKFSYYDISNAVNITAAEILIEKQSGETIEIEPCKDMCKSLFLKGLNYLINIWTKSESLKSKEDPKFISKLIREGGYTEYINKIEGTREKEKKRLQSKSCCYPGRF